MHDLVSKFIIHRRCTFLRWHVFVSSYIGKVSTKYGSVKIEGLFIIAIEVEVTVNRSHDKLIYVLLEAFSSRKIFLFNKNGPNGINAAITAGITFFLSQFN